MEDWTKISEPLGYSLLKGIQEDLKVRLDHCGILYRMFARCKKASSIDKKIKSHPGKYKKGVKLIEDVIGVRIVFYFLSDIKPFCDSLKRSPYFKDISDSEAEFKVKISECKTCEKNPDVGFEELFRPVRLNLVFRMPDDIAEQFRQELENLLPAEISGIIGSTYEVQLRSVLSEGWHEVEHDLRYKFHSDWDNSELESRMLNGIFAALESHEYSMEMLFENMAHQHYVRKLWEPMLRNHLRLRFSGESLSPQINRVFDEDQKCAKHFLRCNRSEIIEKLYRCNRKFPISYDNIVFLINRLSDSPNAAILELESQVTKDILDRIVRGE